jgi:hypothetical protein
MTIEQINALTLEDCFTQILEQLVDFSSLIEGNVKYVINDEPIESSLYDRLVLHEGIIKPTLEAMEFQFIIYQQTLLSLEEKRIAEEIEAERLAILKLKFLNVYAKDPAMHGFKKNNNASDPISFCNDVVLKIWSVGDQDSFIVMLESELLSLTNEQKLESIRVKRNSLLDEADILINKAFDCDSESLLPLKAYRIALRDITEIYKADMSLLDTIDVDAVVFPVKP